MAELKVYGSPGPPWAQCWRHLHHGEDAVLRQVIRCRSARRPCIAHTRPQSLDVFGEAVLTGDEVHQPVAAEHPGDRPTPLCGRRLRSLAGSRTVWERIARKINQVWGLFSKPLGYDGIVIGKL